MWSFISRLQLVTMVTISNCLGLTPALDSTACQWSPYGAVLGREHGKTGLLYLSLSYGLGQPLPVGRCAHNSTHWDYLGADRVCRPFAFPSWHLSAIDESQHLALF